MIRAIDIEQVFPNSFGVYRFCTISKRTIDNLHAALRTVRNISGGHFAGVPFDTCLVKYQGVDASGAKCGFPVFIFTIKLQGELQDLVDRGHAPAVDPRAKLKTCSSCAAPIFWGVTYRGKRVTMNINGTRHFPNCPNTKRHSKETR